MAAAWSRRGRGARGQGTMTVAARGGGLGSAQDCEERSGGERTGLGSSFDLGFHLSFVRGHEKEATERADLLASNCRAPHVVGPTRHGVFPMLNE
jgi:hypothetical protein